jgi:hypothetical protein
MIERTKSLTPPKVLEPLGAVVDRLEMSLNAALDGDRGFRPTVTVTTADLMMLLGTVRKHAPALLTMRIGLTKVEKL